MLLLSFAALISPIPGRSSRCIPSRKSGAARRADVASALVCGHRIPVLNERMAAGSAFLAAAEERGYIHQLTDRDALDAQLAQGPLTAYVGFDCTADSLHVGSLLQIMLLRLWQKTGNKPIVLMGGGTTKVGDPSGKDESRK